MIKVGDKVRVKPSVARPRYNWGDVTHRSVGTVKKLDETTGEMRVDFPEMRDWMGVLPEMEPVLPTPPVQRKAKVIDVEPCELYECAICLTLMVNKNPRMLSCSHTFCEECLTQLIKNEEVSCPTCRQTTPVPDSRVTSIKVNFSLIQMAEREQELAAKFQTQCQICFRKNIKSTATVRCHQCFRMMCDDCKEVHNKVKAYENHIVVSISAEAERTDNCKDHKLPITYVCNACEVGLCVDCTFELTHIGHLDEIEEFDPGIKTHRELITTLEDDIQITLKKLEEKYSNVEDGSVIKKTIKQEITEQAEKLRNQLEDEVEELTETVDNNCMSYVNKALEPVNKAIDKLKESQSSLKSLKQNSDHDFIHNFKEERQKALDVKIETEVVLNADIILPKLKPPEPDSGRLLGKLE